MDSGASGTVAENPQRDNTGRSTRSSPAYPDWAIELDVPEKVIEDLKPFTEAALELLAEVADPFVVVKETKPL